VFVFLTHLVCPLYGSSTSSVAESEKSLSLSALAVDDDCLALDSKNSPHCSCDLLQKSTSYSSRVRGGGSGGASSRVGVDLVGGGLHVGRTYSQAEYTPQRGGHNLKLFQHGEHSTPSALLADIRRVAARMSAEDRARARAIQMLQDYAFLLERKLVPLLLAGYQEHQQLLAAQLEGFSRCDADFQSRLETSRQLQSIYSGWEAMNSSCRFHATALFKDVADCNRHLDDLHVQRDEKCNETRDSTVSVKTLSVVRKDCEVATKDLDEQGTVCRDMDKALITQQTRCDSVHLSLDTAGCLHASQVSGLCGAYRECRDGMHFTFGTAILAARAWEQDSKKEWPAAEMVRCVARGFGTVTTYARDMLLHEVIRECEHPSSNATQIRIQYAEAPKAKECPALVASPCASHGHGQKAMAQVSANSMLDTAAMAAISQESADESHAVALSFLQGSLVHISHEFPARLHRLFLIPFTTASAISYATGLILLTASILACRCVHHLKVRRQIHQDSKDTQKLLSVEADLDSSGEGVVTRNSILSCSSQALHCSQWLCPELIVPSLSKCTIAIPSLAGVNSNVTTLSFGITDRLGQPLISASLLRTPIVPDSNAQPMLLEHLGLTQQDGTVLATCQLRLPQRQDARSHSQCQILKRDGRAFAWLKGQCKRDSGRGSWFFRAVEHASSLESGGDAFTFAFADSTSGRIRVQGDFEKPQFAVVDGMGRMLASVSAGHHFAFDTGARTFYRVDVGGGQDTDLGLVTTLVLAVDRLLCA